jgi:hypothetical protein
MAVVAEIAALKFKFERACPAHRSSQDLWKYWRDYFRIADNRELMAISAFFGANPASKIKSETYQRFAR